MKSFFFPFIISVFFILLFTQNAYSIHFTHPYYHEQWEANTSQTITWELDGYWEEVGHMDLYYSVSGKYSSYTFIGTCWWAGDKAYQWNIPDVESDSCYIKGHWDDGEYETDWYSYVFSIVKTKYIKVIKPNGGERWEVGSQQTVEWQCPNEGRVMIFYSTDGNNGTFKEIFRGAGTAKSFSWRIPNEQSDNCWVKGYWADNEYKEDLSDAAFSIIPTKYITVIKPNGGERWRVGSQQTVEWSCPDNGRVMIFYSSNGKNGTFKEIYRGTADAKSFTWTIPDDKSNDCWVKGYWADNEYKEDLSDAAFSITDQNGFENETTTEVYKNILECSPSPFNTHLRLELAEGAIIYSLTGQIIMKLGKGKHLIDTSDWIDGLYIIKSGNEARKVVKISK